MSLHRLVRQGGIENGSISGDGVAIHGPSDMPAWGRTYRTEAPDLYLGIPYDSEVYSRGRILMLIEYINRLQVK